MRPAGRDAAGDAPQQAAAVVDGDAPAGQLGRQLRSGRSPTAWPPSGRGTSPAPSGRARPARTRRRSRRGRGRNGPVDEVGGDAGADRRRHRRGRGRPARSGKRHPAPGEVQPPVAAPLLEVGAEQLVEQGPHRAAAPTGGAGGCRGRRAGRRRRSWPPSRRARSTPRPARRAGPGRAAPSAAARPHGPPPTTSTSTLDISARRRRRRRRRGGARARARPHLCADRRPARGATATSARRCPTARRSV